MKWNTLFIVLLGCCLLIPEEVSSQSASNTIQPKLSGRATRNARTPGITQNTRQTMVSGIVRGVLSQKKPTKSQHKLMNAFQRRISSRLPVELKTDGEAVSSLKKVIHPKMNNGKGGAGSEVNWINVFQACWCAWKDCPYNINTYKQGVPR